MKNVDCKSPLTAVTRRRFLTLSALGAGAVLLPAGHAETGSPLAEELRFAIISDVHLRYRPAERGCDSATVSAPEDRWAAFLRAAGEWGAEVIIDLGDLQPISFEKGPGQQALAAWNAWPKEKIAVFGNHDNDFMPKEAYLEAMGMPAPFYTKAIKGWTFIVLDSGDPAIAPGTEGRTWGEEQLPWLHEQIRTAPGRCVVLVHYGTEPGERQESNLPPARTQGIIDQANEEAGYRKVVAWFYGHRHRTGVTESGGVHSVHVNSANYRWVSGLGPIYYRDPAPFATGMLGADGELLLRGTGRPGNWAIDDCSGLEPEHRPDDDLTYQANVPLRGQ